MRKTEDGYVPPPKTLIVDNPTRFRFEPKKNPENSYPVSIDDFKLKIVERIVEIIGDKKNMKVEPMATACSIVFDDGSFAHISYNSLFPTFNITGEK